MTMGLDGQRWMRHLFHSIKKLLRHKHIVPLVFTTHAQQCMHMRTRASIELYANLSLMEVSEACIMGTRDGAKRLPPRPMCANCLYALEDVRRLAPPRCPARASAGRTKNFADASRHARTAAKLPHDITGSCRSRRSGHGPLHERGCAG